jgi:asparagine synthase (glutamine-hydrolysing)
MASESSQMAQVFINNMNISDYNKKYNIDNSCYIWLKSFFANTMLNCIGDRSEMAHGIEARLPYLDHNIFEYVRTIRPDIKLKNGEEKYILKQACKPYITDNVYKRKKHMFQAPMPKEQGCFMDLINEVICSNLPKSNLYDKNNVYKFLDSKQDTAKNMAYAFNFSLTTLASMLIIEDYFGLTI